MLIKNEIVDDKKELKKDILSVNGGSNRKKWNFANT
jgi:hypothetical protein